MNLTDLVVFIVILNLAITLGVALVQFMMADR